MAPPHRADVAEWTSNMLQLPANAHRLLCRHHFMASTPSRMDFEYLVNANLGDSVSSDPSNSPQLKYRPDLGRALVGLGAPGSERNCIFSEVISTPHRMATVVFRCVSWLYCASRFWGHHSSVGRRLEILSGATKGPLTTPPPMFREFANLLLMCGHCRPLKNPM